MLTSCQPIQADVKLKQRLCVGHLIFNIKIKPSSLEITYLTRDIFL